MTGLQRVYAKRKYRDIEANEWCAISEKASDLQKSAYNEEIERRAAEFDKWREVYNAKKIIRGNVSFETWSEEFCSVVKRWSEKCEPTPEYARLAYMDNREAFMAALSYVEEHDTEALKEDPDPELLAQMQDAEVWLDNMNRWDKIQKDRVAEAHKREEEFRQAATKEWEKSWAKRCTKDNMASIEEYLEATKAEIRKIGYFKYADELTASCIRRWYNSNDTPGVCAMEYLFC